MKSKNNYFKKAFLTYIIDGKYAKGTVTRMKVALNLFYKWLNGRDLRDIGERQVLHYIKFLKQSKGPTGNVYTDGTVTVYLLTIKTFYEFLYKNDYILTNVLENTQVGGRKKRRLRPMFTHEEIATFLDSIEIKDQKGERNRALYELLYSSGLRISEALNLTLKDINLDERILLVRQGKGSKDRYVPFSETALKFLVKYINNGRKKDLKTIRNEELKKYLFLSINNKLVQSTARRMFQIYLEKCGLDKKGFSFHSIRHSCATHLLENGANIRYVQELLGHECLETTQIYTIPVLDSIKKIYRMYHPRENEYYLEANTEYLTHVKELKKRILKYREEKRKYREKKRMENNRIK